MLSAQHCERLPEAQEAAQASSELLLVSQNTQLASIAAALQPGDGHFPDG